MTRILTAGVFEAGEIEIHIAGKKQDLWENGRKRWWHGLQKSGERHNAVLAVGHYLWYGDSENGIAALPGARNDKYRARLIEEWLTKKHNGFCRHIDQNNWEVIRAQIKRAVCWRGDGQVRDYEPYRLTDRLLKRLLAIFRQTGKVWTVDEFKQANDDRQEEARCKIRAAVAQCLEEGRQISRSTLEALTGCSPNTLKKHADLWKLFAIGSGEYNPGGWGVSCSLSLVPSEPLELENSFLEFENFETGSCSDSQFVELSEPQLPEQPCELAPVLSIAFDSLRLDISGATANNSTASTHNVLAAITPSKSSSGVKRWRTLRYATCAGGSSLGISVRSLNGFPPADAGPPHLPQTGFFLVAHSRALLSSRQGRTSVRISFYGSSVRQSNRKWWHRWIRAGSELFPRRLLSTLRVAIPP
ncbi:MAG: hypothetical protein K2X27_26305 [Candidatus Obscuribacterales bacterium]|nr:hypothetical protein [Candidatus Obscuribacterales bacterium]